MLDPLSLAFGPKLDTWITREPEYEEPEPEYCLICDGELGDAVRCLNCGCLVCEGCAVLVGDDRYCRECATEGECEVEEQEIECQQS
jgi:hypothetical protein